MMQSNTAGCRSPASAISATRRHAVVATSGDDEDDGFMSGAMLAAIGTMAVSFAVRSFRRTRHEMATIRLMWAQRTTVRSLHDAAEAGQALPPVVLLRGRLGADGGPVGAVTPQVPQFAGLLGVVDQPVNRTVELGRQARDGEVPIAGIERDQLPEVEDDASRVVEDAPAPGAAPSESGFLVSELLVTRLGCDARKTTRKDDRGNEKVEYQRDPRAARFVVHHSRNVSKGLHVEDMDGEQAAVRIPPFDIRRNDAPPLFLSVVDPIQEFGSFLRSEHKISLLNAGSPFTHLSKFVFIDQTSITDDGGVFPVQKRGLIGFRTRTGELAEPEKGQLAHPHSSIEAGADAVSGDTASDGALDALAAASTSKIWLWAPAGFYDNNQPLESWVPHRETEPVGYAAFKEQVRQAAELNPIHQRMTDESPQALREKRDSENAFRVVELGIPEEEVTVLAKPVYSERGDRRIALVAPDAPSGNDQRQDRFGFRILKGHSIDNLIHHRRKNLLSYAGLAVMGCFTIKFGYELMANSEVVKFE